jgi:histidinol-phosphate aminotransferase
VYDPEQPAEASADPAEPPPPPVEPPAPRDAVQHAHRVRRSVPDREGYLRLDLGESARPASPAVLAAMRGLDGEALASYPDPYRLQEALAALHGVDAACVSVTAGTDEAIRLLFATYVEEGARVLLPRPSFGAYIAAADAAGAFVERVDHREDLSLDLELVRAALNPRTPRLVALSNPNAPTGTANDPAVLLSLAGESPGSLFVVNESFGAWHGRSLLDEPGSLPANVAVLRSFSKDYGLAGLRVGYVVAHPAVIDAMEVVRPSYTVSAPSIAGALAALQEPHAMRAHVARVRGVMDRLVEQLQARNIEAHATRANFVLIKLASPIQPWAAAFAARRILVGTAGHGGPMAPYIRVTMNDDDESARFLDALDLLLAQGVQGAARVRGVQGDWDDVGSEGMA